MTLVHAKFDSNPNQNLQVTRALLAYWYRSMSRTGNATNSHQIMPFVFVSFILSFFFHYFSASLIPAAINMWELDCQWWIAVWAMFLKVAWLFDWIINIQLLLSIIHHSLLIFRSPGAQINQTSLINSSSLRLTLWLRVPTWEPG